MSQPIASEKPAFFSTKHSNLVLAIVMLGTMMGALDSTIVLLAFPVINDSLHSDLATSLWIILAYLLILAVATTQMGRIGDIYGRSRIFNLGFVIFTVGSALCGFSPHIYPLIAFRCVQAAGGAIMQATSGAIIADYFPREKRGKAYGYNSLGFTSGAMLGIVLATRNGTSPGGRTAGPIASTTTDRLIVAALATAMARPRCSASAAVSMDAK